MPQTKPMTDYAIAKSAMQDIKPITDIAKRLGLGADDIEVYGRYKAKIDIDKALAKPTKKGKLILVTAISPTPAGEGKTTLAIGLADALQHVGESVALALREPSLGPVFGVKGGAAGGGYAQVLPMEDINLHFTGDFHAISSANNLLAAMIDNHIYQGNSQNINPKKVVWRRVVDMNDRQLRNILSGLGNATDGVIRPDGFDITVASEVMAVFCLAQDLADLKTRLGAMLIGYRFDNTPVFAKDLSAEGAMTALLKDAFKPNLVQTIFGVPAFVHGGPFANIAHGCNSVVATKLATHLADLTVTEAGFGADLGAEKFCNIKCRLAELAPDAVVVVATVRALKYNGGMPKNELDKASLSESLTALKQGLPNLLKHVQNIKTVLGLPVVVAINRFDADSDEELSMIETACQELGVSVSLATVWADGAKGGVDLAKKVIAHAQEPANFQFTYDTDGSIADKITAIATKIYGADGVDFGSEALADIQKIERLGLDKLPICMAKTQYSFSDNAKLLGVPTGFRITVRSIGVASGAGFLVVLCGNIMRMPGLPKTPAAEQIDVVDGEIVGLF